MMYLTGIAALIIWVYLLSVLKRCKLHAWHFLLGSLGLFVFMMIFLRPVLVKPLARCVAAIAGGFGSLTETFTAYFKYGILFVHGLDSTITLQIDFECSGIIEIMAFVALLAFFQVYDRNEKLFVGVLGTLGIIFSNVLRIIVICLMIYFGGTGMYYVAHAIVGRLLFYGLSVLLYFYVFTKPQIIRTKVGKFTYGNH
ncbi:hypothetical protein IMSAG185_00510 [Lachnospiraceae bacterium]|nr:hypothetical protein IMSAG185_00510 [Lachnospiraceae bacterium]